MSKGKNGEVVNNRRGVLGIIYKKVQVPKLECDAKKCGGNGQIAWNNSVSFLPLV